MSDQEEPTAESLAQEQQEDAEAGELRNYFNATDSPYRMDQWGHTLGGNEHGAFRHNRHIQYGIEQGWIVDKGEVGEEEDSRDSTVPPSEQTRIVDQNADADEAPAPKREDGVQRNRKRAGKTGSDESQEK